MEMSSALDIASPKNIKAIIAAKIGETLPKKATLERDMSFTLTLKMKKVIVPEIDLIAIIFH